MKRIAILLYGIVSYLIFFGTFLYALGFVGNVIVPKSIDTGVAPSWATALAVNLGLLGLFAIQHSGMARPAFKRWLTRFVPPSAERSTYVLVSSLAFILLFWAWQPLPATVWSFEGETARNVAMAVYFAGAGLVLYSTFLIDHFDLFGLRQVVLQFRGVGYTEKNFVTPSLYKHIRHPLYLGWFIVFWATPDMTVGHLLMAIGTTGYILGAIVLEERDLSDLLGPEYRAYRERTPMFVPRVGGQRRTDRTDRTARSAA
jgi:protein-S-isoprenylcysteine O-methyltransferase Ste14